MRTSFGYGGSGSGLVKPVEPISIWANFTYDPGPDPKKVESQEADEPIVLEKPDETRCEPRD